MANQRRADERRRREAAQAGAAGMEPVGHGVAGRSSKQMVSVRLEAQLLKELRDLAEAQNVSVSDLLRRAAVELVERSRTASVRVQYWSAEVPSVITSSLTAGTQVTSGVFITGEDTSPR
jgi:uncharacterized protein (DUF4415 family)